MIPLVLPLLLVAAPAGAAELQVRGLVVGVDRFDSYRVPPLAYAVSDARRFRNALVDNGGGAFRAADLEFITDEGATRERVADKARALLADADGDDVVVLFFSTHGYVQEDKGYLYMFDTQTATLSDSGLPLADLHAWIEASQARHVLLFTDACHAAAVGTLRSGEGFPEDNRFNAVLDSLQRSEGSFFNLASSLVQQQSFESWAYCGGGGAFTCALTEALAGAGDLDGDGRVDLAELSTRVQGRVMEMTGYDQTPEAKGDYDPELVLAIPGSGALRPPALPKPAFDAPAFAEPDPDEPELEDESAGGVLMLLGSGEGEGEGAWWEDGGVLGGAPVDFGSIEDRLFESGGPDSSLADPELEEDRASVDDTKGYAVPFRPTAVLGLGGGVALGAVDPVLRVGSPDDAGWQSSAQPAGLLRLGLRQGWWFNPSLVVGLQRATWEVSEVVAVDVTERTEGPATRLGVELREALHLFPYRVFSPYLVGSVGSWGGRWVQDAAGTRYRNDPLAGPFSVGGGAGLLYAPWWSGLLSFDLEGQATTLVGGELGGGVAGRVSLGVELYL